MKTEFIEIKNFGQNNYAMFRNSFHEFKLDEKNLIDRIKNLKKLGYDISSEYEALRAIRKQNNE